MIHGAGVVTVIAVTELLSMGLLRRAEREGTLESGERPPDTAGKIWTVPRGIRRTEAREKGGGWYGLAGWAPMRAVALM